MANTTPRKRKGIDDAALAKLSPKQTQYRHGIGSGLYLLVKPNGTKTFRFDYVFGTYTEGKHIGEPVRKTITFAVFDEAQVGKSATSQVGQAMTALGVARDHLKAGRDPLAIRELGDEAPEANGFPPFAKVAKGWLTTLAGKSYKTRNRAENMVRYLSEGVERDGVKVAAGFGAVTTDKVTADHLLPLLVAFENEYETRRRLLPAAREIIAYARPRQMWPKTVSPFEGISAKKGFAEHVSKRRPAIIVPQPFGELLRRIGGYRADKLRTIRHTHEQIGLKLLALTFVRPGNVEQAEWSEFEFGDVNQWIIPAPKLKMFSQRNKAATGDEQRDLVVPLSRQAVALLMELRKRTGNSRYLFPGESSLNADIEIPLPTGRLNDALVELGYQGIHCAHGFRSTASTLLNKERVTVGGHQMLRWPEQGALIEVQLDHDDESTRAIYNRDGGRLTERAAMMQFWADKVDQMRNGAEVIKLAA